MTVAVREPYALKLSNCKRSACGTSFAKGTVRKENIKGKHGRIGQKTQGWSTPRLADKRLYN